MISKLERYRDIINEYGIEAAEFIRDSVIVGRDHNQTKAHSLHLFRMAQDRFEFENPEAEDKVGCVWAALSAIFGPDALENTDEAGFEYNEEEELIEFIKDIAYYAANKGLKHVSTTSAADFIVLMEDQNTIGALLEQEVSNTNAHWIGIKPITIIGNSPDDEAMVLTDTNQLETKPIFAQALAVTDTKFAFDGPTITKYAHFEILPELFASTFGQEPGHVGAVVFQRDLTNEE